MIGGFLLVPLFWGTPWGGASPGPRYMLPAYPMLIAGVAVAWSRVGLWARAAAVYGGFVMVLASITDPLLSTDVGLGSWVRLLLDGVVAMEQNVDQPAKIALEPLPLAAGKDPGRQH